MGSAGRWPAVFGGSPNTSCGVDPDHPMASRAVATEIVANRETYSLRELVAAAVALHNPWFRFRKNLLARKTSMYCSGFVQHIFDKAGINLAPGVHPSHGTPEDISRTPLPHTTYLLQCQTE
jgi:cell wall-associated NlpC family hydrolase